MPKLEAIAFVTDVPYQPSWQNWFYARAARLPVHRYLVYILVGLVITLVLGAMPWVTGDLPWGTIDLYQLNFQGWLPVALIAADYFIGRAGSALDQFRPALPLDDGAYARLRFEFTQVPWRTGWLITGLAGVFSFAGLSFGRPYQQSGPSAVPFYLLNLFMFSMVFFLFFFLWRTLRRTAELYGRVEDINIFHLDPLYAFSSLSSRAGIFFAIVGLLSYVTNIVVTDSPNLGGFWFFAVLNGSLALIAFFYPIRGIHDRLASAKEQAAKENDRRLESAYRELHRRADHQDTAGMTEFHHLVQAILEFRREIHSISTWPWSPGTLRAFFTALLLPIVLWGIQQVLTRLVA